MSALSSLIRLRTNLGVYRVQMAEGNPITLQFIADQISSQLPGVTLTSPLSFRPYSETASPSDPLAEGTDYTTRLPNGAMLYTFVDPNSPPPGSEASKATKKTITKDGNVELQSYEQSVSGQAFRPGMLPLRSMKKHWTLQEFTEMDSAFQFKIKGGGASFCKAVKLEVNEAQSFQSYLRDRQFHQCRMGYMYGRVSEGEEVEVEFVYEPMQEADDTSFNLVETEEAEKERENVEEIANLIGLKKVGWIFGHPPREEGFIFSGEEVLTAAELQLEAADGVEDTTFVTVKVTVDAEGKAEFNAFTLSKQAMEMVAEGALELMAEPGFCKVNETFTAIVEGKGAKKIDNAFWLQNVAIKQGEGQFVSWFPKVNRDGSIQTHAALGSQLSKSGKKGFTFEDCMSDFQALLYLTKFFPMSDVSNIIEGIKKKKIEDGYKIMISSMAGVDGAY
ncbi:hypothetical protein TrST_g4432 [Triparma strigata]|uniref:Nuclear pore localisation protein NPL4 C-terminal domain-containing protein n=1 Tax=Triparma strigata TaxID=1606541 RepID=A0A9W7C1E9_9STRA|nr:hypothetical protein TrST_g4432 [Triparma strigata]